MTPDTAIDVIVECLAGIEANLSGDDSGLATPWDEIKEQLQNGLSPYWPAYLSTMQQLVAGFVSDLDDADRTELMGTLKCASPNALRAKLLQRLLTRGKKEEIRYSPFDFEYFSYPLLDIMVYGQVIKRTGLDDFHAMVYSAAAPFGEQGRVQCSTVESILSREQFEAARAHRWPPKG